MLILALLLLLALHLLGGWWRALALACALLVELAAKWLWAWYLRRLPAAVGAEAMIGRPVTALTDCRPCGRVRYGPERWSARCAQGARVGERLVIDAVERGTLLVSRRDAAGA